MPTPDPSFEEDWLRLHAGRKPLRWELREDPHLPWVRFHGLPNAKRYPESGAEKATILVRGNALAGSVLGRNAACWLVQWDGASPARATAVEWLPGGFDEMLRSVAEDNHAPVLWLNRTTGAIFSPYDGGFDLFPETAARVEELRAAYPDWVSRHPRGL